MYLFILLLWMTFHILCSICPHITDPFCSRRAPPRWPSHLWSCPWGLHKMSTWLSTFSKMGATKGLPIPHSNTENGHEALGLHCPWPFIFHVYHVNTSLTHLKEKFAQEECHLGGLHICGQAVEAFTKCPLDPRPIPKLELQKGCPSPTPPQKLEMRLWAFISYLQYLHITDPAHVEECSKVAFTSVG